MNCINFAALFCFLACISIGSSGFILSDPCTPNGCNDNNPCTTDICDPFVGCQYMNITCNDFNPCTVDKCYSSTAAQTVTVTWNVQGVVYPLNTAIRVGDTVTWSTTDAKPHTVMSTDGTGELNIASFTSSSRSHTFNTAGTFRYYCSIHSTTMIGAVEVLANGVGCTHATVANCSKCANVICTSLDGCHPSECNPSNGLCTVTPMNCFDNNMCTSDACTGQACVFTPYSCDDGDLCTMDMCKSTGGCFWTSISCDDRNLCTTDRCLNGTCFLVAMCSDQDPCTIDTCDPVTGTCSYPQMNCDDGNPCTTDGCSNGACYHTPVMCAGGRYCDMFGSCIPCPVGTTYNPVTMMCDDCPPGSWGPGGQDACTPCLANYYLPLGSEMSADGCIPCPCGTASVAGSTSCTPCKKGFHRTSSLKCAKCAVGTYAPATGYGTCLNCPAGTYASVTGSSSCTMCPAGTYSAPGAAACVACPAPTTCPAGSTTSADCM